MMPGSLFPVGIHPALCLVPILRERTSLAEEVGLWWAATRKTGRLLMKDATDQARALGTMRLSEQEGAALRTRFVALWEEGNQVHPRAPTPNSKRGKAI